MWLTFYLFLAFPMGRLEGRAERILMAALAIVLAVGFVPWALLSPVIAGGGPLSACVPACPENVLQIGSNPELVEWAGNVETYGALAVTLGVLIVYVLRLRAATRPQLRALIAVAATSLLFLPAFFMYHFSRLVLEASPQTLDVMQWGIVATRILLPLGFLAALLQAETSPPRRWDGCSSGSPPGLRWSDGATTSPPRSTIRPSGSATPSPVARTLPPGRRLRAHRAASRIGPNLATRRSRRKAGRGDGDRRGADRGSGAGAGCGCRNTARRGERAPRGRAPCLARTDRRGRGAPSAGGWSATCTTAPSSGCSL